MAQSISLNEDQDRRLRVVKAACPHDCPDTCAMLVTVEDGRAVKVTGDPNHPFTRGFLCTKVANYEQRTPDVPQASGSEGRAPLRAHQLG